MSQITTNINSIGPAGPIVTLEGNSGGAVPPNGAGNIFVVGSASSFVNVTGNPGTNTLTIELLNQQVAVVTTTDATPTALFSFPVVAGRAVTIKVDVIAAVDDYSAAFGGSASVVGSRTLVGTPTITAFDNSFNEGIPGNPDVSFIVVGNSIQFMVIGVAATTINWKGVLTFISV